MAVSLTKIVNGRAVEIDTLPNQQTVKCPRCEQTYRLAYTDSEWHKLSAWLGKADRAMRESHKKRHDATALELRW
jgi:spore germination protein YaaH